MKKKRLVTIAVVAVSAIVLAACFRHSQPPKEWRAISLGMPRTQVLALVSTEVFDQRHAKGFDMTRTQSCRRLGALGYWMLVMSYDSSNRLAHAQIEFVCYDNPQSNVLWPSQLLYRINKGSLRLIK